MSAAPVSAPLRRHFLKRFLVCAVREVDRLAVWEEGPIPSSTAECLALRAIVQRAEAVLQINAEEEGREPDDDFEFKEVAFPDLDVELLFDPALDGIEDTEVAQYMGMALKPSEWFEPTYGEVHPYCRCLQVSEAGESASERQREPKLH